MNGEVEEAREAVEELHARAVKLGAEIEELAREIVARREPGWQHVADIEYLDRALLECPTCRSDNPARLWQPQGLPKNAVCPDPFHEEGDT